MRQTTALLLLSMAILAAVSLANPVEDVRKQIDAEFVADFLKDMLKTDIPDDTVVSSLDLTINLEPKDSSKEVQTPSRRRGFSSRGGSSVPATRGRGRPARGPNSSGYSIRGRIVYI